MSRISWLSVAIAGFGVALVVAVGISSPSGVDALLRGDTYEPLTYVLYIGCAYLLLGGATRASRRLSYERALIIAIASSVVLYVLATVAQYVDVFVYVPVPNATLVPTQLLIARLDFALSLVPITMALPLGVAIETEDDRGVLVAGGLALVSYGLAIVLFLSTASGFFSLLFGLFILLGIAEVIVALPVYSAGKAAAESGRS